ncbi:MAG TPA: hypothetical protein VJK51_00320 [Candidatus Nanoarchaeia archaeon]|nr:hypothetical protein [Candidatus Nanoarchaeia archaeon]
MDARDQQLRKTIEKIINGSEDDNHVISIREIFSVPIGLLVLAGNEIYQQTKHLFYHLRSIPHQRKVDDYIEIKKWNTTETYCSLPYCPK